MVRYAFFLYIFFITTTGISNSVFSKEETDNLATKVLPPGLVVVHDSAGRCDDNFAVKSEMVY